MLVQRLYDDEREKTVQPPMQERMRQPLPDVRHEPVVVRGRFVIAQPRHDDQMGAALGVAFCGVSPPRDGPEA
ncbi:hypothetical protein [Streptomyces calvus]